MTRKKFRRLVIMSAFVLLATAAQNNTSAIEAERTEVKEKN